MFRIGSICQIVRGDRLVCALAGDRGLGHRRCGCRRVRVRKLYLSSMLRALAPDHGGITCTTVRLCGQLGRKRIRDPTLLSDGGICGVVRPILYSVTARRV